jgi:hypothetical protein
MSANILMISEQSFKDFTIASNNIDLKNLTQVIKMTQDRFIHPLCGSALYNKILTLIDNGTITSGGNAVYKTLLDSYLTDTLFNYVLVGAGTRFRVLDVVNDTTNIFLQNKSSGWFERQLLMTTVQTGSPAYYNFNGVDQYGDTQVDVFPVPDAGYDLYFNIVMPQDDFTTDVEEVKIPYTLLIEGTLSRALSERGEDGGYQDQEARYRNMLADLIAIEAGSRPEETVWYPS